MPIDPQIRSQVARLGGLSLSATHDPREYTRAARQAFSDRFLAEVDADLAPAERERRAGAARKRYFAELALKSAMARRAKGRK